MNTFKSLSKRERNIAISVIVLVGLYIIYQFLLVPYLAQRDAIAAGQMDTTSKLAEAARTFNKQQSLKKVWADIQAGGLKSNRSQAESQAQQALLDWARSAGVNIVSIKSERDQQLNQFQVISFHVTGTGTMLSISNLLWSLETASIPVHMNDLQIAPRKEGTDDLTLQVTVSTLCLPPESAGKMPVSMVDGRSVWR